LPPEGDDRDDRSAIRQPGGPNILSEQANACLRIGALMNKSFARGTVAAALCAVLLSGSAWARGPAMNLTDQAKYDQANPVRPLAGSGQRVNCSDPLNQSRGLDLKNASCPPARTTPDRTDYNGGTHPRTH
jgi:hypothetical protein